MKTPTLGADQFMEFVLTRDRNETWNEVDFELQEYRYSVIPSTAVHIN